MSKRNVAVVHHFFAHYRGAIIEELVKSGSHDYSFVGDNVDPQGLGRVAYEFSDGARFIHAPCIAMAGGVLLQRGLIRLALSRKFDAVVYLGDVHYASTWVSAALARLTGKRVLFWTHGWLKNEDGLRSSLRCAFYRIAHGLLLYGDRAKQIGLTKGFHADDLYVIYNSLDKRTQERVRSEITADDIRSERIRLFGHWDRPVVICAGRLVRERRLDLLLEAAHSLQEEGHRIDILLVGDGPEKASLEASARDKQVCASFPGACYDERQLGLMFMLSNVTVFPGAIGLTAMHSLVYGTPVITHDDAEDQKPEWEAIVPDVNGQLFKKGDVGGLARAIGAWTRTALPDETVRRQCYTSIDRHYDPRYQTQMIDLAVTGRSADAVEGSGMPIPT